MRGWWAGLAIGVVLAASPVVAQELAQTQQTLDHIRLVLAGYQRASLMDETPLDAVAWPERQPRHVYESAVELAQRVALLSRFLGGTDTLSPSAPPGDVMPAQLHDLVQRTDAALVGLAPRFGHPPIPPLPARPDDASGAEITRRLASAITAVTSLGLPDAVSNDASALALTLLAELEAVRQLRAKGAPADQQAPDHKRTIADGLRQLQILNRTLTEVTTAQPALAPPGGIARLAPIEGPPSMMQVIEPLRALLADVRVMHARLRPDRVAPVVPTLSGQAPGHLYATLRMAVATAQALR